MRVLLLYPPPAPATIPYGSLPALTSWLRQHGHQVVQRDMNAEIWDWLLSQEGLATTLDLSARRLSLGADELCSNPLMPYRARGASQPDVSEKLKRCLEADELLRTSIDDAAALIRGGPGFYSPDEYWRSVSIITLAESLYQSAYFLTSRQGLRNFDEWRDPLVGFANDESENHLIRLFCQLFLPSILAYAPDLVGLSVPFGDQLMPALTMAAMLKRERPGIKIVLGGPMITQFRDGFACATSLYEVVDYFIVFEGEAPLLALINTLESGGDLSDVPGLLYRDGTTSRSNPPADPVAMDALPSPVFDGFPLSRYLAPEVVFPLAASTRCYWNACAFCALSPSRSRSRCAQPNLRTADRLVADVENLQTSYGAKYFLFSDLAVAPAVLRQFSDRIVDRGLDIRWSCFARFENSFDEHLCSRLAKSGCRRLMFGLESGNPRVNRLLNKGTDLAQARRIIGYCRDSGITVEVSCIVGFPTETREEAGDTAAFFLDNSNAFGPFMTFSFHPFSLMRGSRIHRTPEKYGIVLDRDGFLSPFSGSSKYRVSTGIGQDEARSLCETFYVAVAEKLRDKAFFAGLDFGTHTLFYADHYLRGADCPHERSPVGATKQPPP